MTIHSSRYPLLIGLIISIAIHLISLLLSAPIAPPEPTAQKPILIEVQPRQPQRETVIPQQPQQPIDTAKRQGVADQLAKKEQAPKGHAAEDSSPSVAQPQPAKPKQPQQPSPKPQQSPTEVQPVVEKQPSTVTIAKPVEKPPQPLPSLEQLLNAGKNAAADITRESGIKNRPNIENGDELLLNMKQDKLFSFFSRFKKQIYAVWNYPEESIERRQQGVALLNIVINRDGSVEDVDLLSASGHERLDREAIAAIFKAQPYGRLPDSYPEDQLTIKAYFEYIIGQDRPNIYR